MSSFYSFLLSPILFHFCIIHEGLVDEEMVTNVFNQIFGLCLTPLLVFGI